MIGVGSDGAAVVSGCRNSVWTRLQEKNKNLVRFTCICHSLAKVAEEGFNELPSRLSAILSMVPKWFRKSDKRKNQYNELFDKLQEESEQPITGKPFEKYAQTRWLCRAKVIKLIIDNWDTLVDYFDSILTETKLDQKFTVSLILEILRDSELKKLLIFAHPILELLENKNQMFQSDYTDPFSAVEELRYLKNSFLRRIKDHAGNAKNLDDVDFGSKFIMSLPTSESKNRALKFLEKIVTGIEKRTLNSVETVKSIACAKPTNVLNGKIRPLFSNFPENKFKTDDAEQEYRILIDFKWTDNFDKPLADVKPSDFWNVVYQHPKFKNLGMYMLSLMLMPLSNAATERIFSICGSIKTKTRNKMIISTLDALVMIKTTFHHLKKCCFDFEVTSEMLNHFNLDMYK